MYCRLRNEPALAVATLPAASADLIVAHPPWGVHTFPTIEDPDFGSGGELAAALRAAERVLTPQGSLMVAVPEIIRRSNTLLFCPQAVERTIGALGLRLGCIDFWLKTSKGGLHAGRRWVDSKCDEELAHSILEWLMIFRRFRRTPEINGEIMVYPIERDPLHPAVWPYDLAKKLVERHSSPGDSVVDLFMGRGTIGRACIALGRSFTGFEICPDFFHHAVSYTGSTESG